MIPIRPSSLADSPGSPLFILRLLVDTYLPIIKIMVRVMLVRHGENEENVTMARMQLEMHQGTVSSQDLDGLMRIMRANTTGDMDGSLTEIGSAQAEALADYWTPMLRKYVEKNPGSKIHLFPGCPRVVSREGLRSPPEGISGGCLGASREHFPRFEQPQPKLLGTNKRKGKLNLDSIANGNSAIRIRTRIRTPIRSRQEVDLGNSNSNLNSASDSRELKLDHELQAELSFCCTSSQVYIYILFDTLTVWRVPISPTNDGYRSRATADH